MKSIEEYIKEKRVKEIVNEILDLKMASDTSDKVKFKIQKLQQELNELTLPDSLK